jgi:MYXO-CTERM domain-containing protein
LNNDSTICGAWFAWASIAVPAWSSIWFFVKLVISDANDFGNNIGTVAGWRIDFGVTAIPEPGAFALLTIAAAALVCRRR